MRPFMLYHWSPASNRKSIASVGLRAGLRSRDGTWVPKHLCFCRTPSAAWSLSAMHDRRRIAWDLWCCWSTHIAPYTTRFAGSDAKLDWTMTEYQSRRSVPKSRLWFVGTRKHQQRSRR